MNITEMGLKILEKQSKKHTKSDQKILKKNTRHQKGSKLNSPAFKI